MLMIVGVCRLTLSIAGSYPLTNKRRVVTSVVERVRHRSNVAVAAVAGHEVWNAAIIGVCHISMGSAHAREVLDHIVAFVANGHGDAVTVDHTVEIVTGF